MPGGFAFPLRGPLGLQLQLGKVLVLFGGVQLRQAADHCHRQADIRHGGHGGGAPAGGLPQFPLGEGDPQPQALARFREMPDPAGGVVRRVGGQQDHPGVPGPCHSLHRLLAYLQIPSPEA